MAPSPGTWASTPLVRVFLLLCVCVSLCSGARSKGSCPTKQASSHPTYPNHTGFTNWLPVSYLQEAEIKHCRIAMLATLGWIVADLGIHLPGTLPTTYPPMPTYSSSYLTHPPAHLSIYIYR